MQPIPYSRQQIDTKDLKAVRQSLQNDLITTGPSISQFEKNFALQVGSKYAVAVSSGTAALHLVCLAAGLKNDDEVITSPLTFAASANCALYCQAKPVFIDINDQGLIDTAKIEAKINKHTKIIIPVHYAGLPCDLGKINIIAKKHKLIIIEDACHALGAEYKNFKIGSCKYSAMTVFSFHPVKHITTGEGGMITVNSKEIYEKLLALRSHGIVKEAKNFINQSEGPWYYEMQDLGFNYRLTDFQSALGISQLRKLNQFIAKRRKIAKLYDQAFNNHPEIEIIKEKPFQFSSYHLYPILVKNSKVRLKLFNYLKSNNILCQVNYIPVYWHPFYQKLGYKQGLCPKAERFYQREVSLPIFPAMKLIQVRYIIEQLLKFLKED